MKQPLTRESISLGDCLNDAVTWSKTQHPTALWRAQVGPQTWTVRVNDFPEDHLYTLLIDEQEIGAFDEWPQRWVRAGESSRPHSENSE